MARLASALIDGVTKSVTKPRRHVTKFVTKLRWSVHRARDEGVAGTVPRLAIIPLIDSTKPPWADRLAAMRARAHLKAAAAFAGRAQFP
jgi:hypothetical protein